jgi:hypothetical protein
VSYVRISDDFADHPKVRKLNTTAFAVHVWVLCHCGRHLTDGFVALEALAGCPWVSKRSALTRAIERLVGAGLWEQVDGGFRIHDYLTYNPDRPSVLEKRRLAAERQARWRENKEKQKQRSDASRNASTDGRVTHTPTPAPKGAGGKAAAAPLRGAPRLVEDDCMRCPKVRPLHEFKGYLWCIDCVLGYSGELEHDLREHIQTLRAAS